MFGKVIGTYNDMELRVGQNASVEILLDGSDDESNVGDFNAIEIKVDAWRIAMTKAELEAIYSMVVRNKPHIITVGPITCYVPTRGFVIR